MWLGQLSGISRYLEQLPACTGPIRRLSGRVCDRTNVEDFFEHSSCFLL